MIAQNIQEPQPLLRVFIAGKPVSVNRMYVTGRGRNHYSGRRRSNEAIAWQQCVWVDCIRYRSPALSLLTTLTVEIDLYQLRANADPDNYIKATLDGLAQALGINDKHFCQVTVRRMPWVKGRTQGAMLTVWEAQ